VLTDGCILILHFTPVLIVIVEVVKRFYTFLYCKMESILNKKHVAGILQFLASKGTVKRNEMLEVVPSNAYLDKLLPELERIGLVSIETKMIGRKIIFITITLKGRQVAEQLKRAEEAAKGQLSVQISDQEARDWAERFRETTRGMSLLYHVNVFEDHITIGQDVDGKTRVINIYVKVNGNGIMRLWCEEDESFECIHVQYAWTLPRVQEMYANNVKDGRVNGK